MHKLLQSGTYQKKKKKEKLASCLFPKQDGGAIKCFHLLLCTESGREPGADIATTFIKQHDYFSLMIAEQTKFGKPGFLL